MPLASFDDANQWLDNNKLKFVDDGDAEPEANNAENIIKGILFAEFSDLVPLWTTPETTPVMVREIASLLMAAYRYARKYSEQTPKTSSYAAWLEDKAMLLLTGIADGTIKLVDVSPLPVGSAFQQDDFWPNDTTAALEPEDEIKFTMRKVF